MFNYEDAERTESIMEQEAVRNGELYFCPFQGATVADLCRRGGFLLKTCEYSMCSF